MGGMHDDDVVARAMEMLSLVLDGRHAAFVSDVVKTIRNAPDGYFVFGHVPDPHEPYGSIDTAIISSPRGILEIVCVLLRAAQLGFASKGPEASDDDRSLLAACDEGLKALSAAALFEVLDQPMGRA